MPSPQVPIASGFGMRSEPADILDSVDLTGKRVVITGGYSGLGLETTRALAGVGATIVAPARRPDHAAQVFANAIPKLARNAYRIARAVELCVVEAIKLSVR